MEKIVVDPDVIVDYVRGSEKAAEFLDNLAPDSRFITIVNAMEVLQGAENKYRDNQWRKL